MQLGASGSLCWLQLLFRLINCSMKFEVAMLIRAYIMWLEEAPIHREEEWSEYRVAAIRPCLMCVLIFVILFYKITFCFS